MNTFINYRAGTTADASALAATVSEVIISSSYYNDLAKHHEAARYNTAALSAKIAADPYSVIVAMDGDGIAGFCLSRFDDFTIWLEWFGVVSAYRNQGIAARLLAEPERHLPARQCHKIWCDCRTENTGAIHLLSKAGYTRLATLNNHWYGQDFLLWDKLIALPTPNTIPDE